MDNTTLDGIRAIDSYRAYIAHRDEADRMHRAVSYELDRAVMLADTAQRTYLGLKSSASQYEVFRQLSRAAIKSAASALPGPSRDGDGEADGVYWILMDVVARMTDHPIACEYTFNRISEIRDTVTEITGDIYEQREANLSRLAAVAKLYSALLQP